MGAIMVQDSSLSGTGGTGEAGGAAGVTGVVAPAIRIEPVAFERVGAACAIAAGVSGFLYAVSFVVLRSTLLSGLFLLLGGLLGTAVYVALHQRLSRFDPPLALWAVLLGVAAALGSALHGGYDLANALHPPAAPPDIPSPVNPRGLMTFGVAGMAVALVAWQIVRTRALPAGVGYLGYLLAALMVAIYLGRLIILDPTNPAVVALVLPTGFIVNPAWYLWLGASLWRAPRT